MYTNKFFVHPKLYFINYRKNLTKNAESDIIYPITFIIMKKFYITATIMTVLYALHSPSKDTPVAATTNAALPVSEKLVKSPPPQPPQTIPDDENQSAYDDWKDDVPLEISPQNEEFYLGLEDELIICLAYVEDYKSSSYFCGKRWTIGYGSTIYADGTRVKSGETIDMLSAQKCVRAHLRKHVFPYIDQYVKRPLTRQEIIGTSMFIYNVGPGNFKNSAFLKAINNGITPFECSRRMTEFTKSAGKVAKGLLKREWVQSAIYCGYITPYDLLELKPAGFYNYRVEDFYKTSGRLQDGYYKYNFSKQKLQEFLHDNQSSSKRVIDII